MATAWLKRLTGILRGTRIRPAARRAISSGHVQPPDLRLYGGQVGHAACWQPAASSSWLPGMTGPRIECRQIGLWKGSASAAGHGSLGAPGVGGRRLGRPSPTHLPPERGATAPDLTDSERSTGAVARVQGTPAGLSPLSPTPAPSSSAPWRSPAPPAPRQRLPPRLHRALASIALASSRSRVHRARRERPKPERPCSSQQETTRIQRHTAPQRTCAS